MKKNSVDIDINLLPEDPFFQTVIGRTMKWAVSIGRYIVIFTELIVIVSFGARFSLDRQLTDLNNDIHQKQIVVESFGDLEAKILSVQAKLAEYTQLKQQKNLTDIFGALSEITPPDVQMSQLEVDPTQVVMTGHTPSQTSLNILINNLQVSPQFFNVRVEKIQADTSDQTDILFQISADTQKTAKVNRVVTPPGQTAPASTSNTNGDAL